MAVDGHSSSLLLLCCCMGSRGGRSDVVDEMPSSALSLARDRDDLGCHGQ